MNNNINHYAGCLLGGALGDALGAPVETLTYKEITKEYGHDGVVELQCNIYGLAEITNDTQLTLFTAEGLLRDKCRRGKKGAEKDVRETTNVIYRAYLRWLYTQGLSTSHWDDSDYDGWLVGVKALYAKKEIATTCITTLGKGVKGRLSKPINNSSTCGTVIRIAPVGLFADTKDEAFDLGKRVGAITHGHPLAYYSSAAMAVIIYNIVHGMDIMEATLDAIKELEKRENTQELIEKLKQAIELYETKASYMRALKTLGSGREAIESLAIGVYCSLSCPDDIVEALRLAVNHGGDSDSTGSITGNIVGTYLGKEAIPQDWLNKLQLAKEIEQMAVDLNTRHCHEEDWSKKYPSW